MTTELMSLKRLLNINEHKKITTYKNEKTNVFFKVRYL